MKRYCIIEFDTILYYTWYSKVLNYTQNEIVSHDMTSWFFLIIQFNISRSKKPTVLYTHPEESKYIQPQFSNTDKVFNWWQQMFIIADIIKITFCISFRIGMFVPIISKTVYKCAIASLSSACHKKQFFGWHCGKCFGCTIGRVGSKDPIWDRGVASIWWISLGFIKTYTRTTFLKSSVHQLSCLTAYSNH